MIATRSGLTLVELLVVVALLGIAAAVAGYSGAGQRAVPRSENPLADSIITARRQALSTGKTVRLVVAVDSAAIPVVALPDGRVITPDTRVDALTGRMIGNAH